MTSYAYKAKSGPGNTVEGAVEAETRGGALAWLDEQGLTPIWVREAAETRPGGRGMSLGVMRRPSFRDVTVFTQQLASLTRAGVPILRTLSTIAGQTENRKLARVVRDLTATVRDGNMLSAALSDYRALFPDLYINMVRAGEGAGILDTILQRLAEAREREEEMRRKVQAALAYPLLILTVGAATVFILLAFFLPRVIALFRGYKNLPLPTRILIGVSDVFGNHWHWMLMIGILVAAVLNRLAALEKGRTFFDALKLRLPLLGRFIQEAEISRFARTLSLLIDAGIPIDRSLSLSADTMRNAVLRQEIERIRDETVNQGAAFSAGLDRGRFFPALMTNMAAVGEEAGSLDAAMTEVSLYYEKQCDQRARLATSLIEPILILAVGVIVGFIVAAMLLPIFELGTGL